MKRNVFLSIVLIFIYFSCSAQNPILPLLNADLDQNNAYYKDVNGDLDQFVGTWKWQVGNTSLTIVLEKRVQVLINHYDNTTTYEDILIGGYKYVENGVEIVNTISLLNNQFSDPYHYTIKGNLIIEGNHGPLCNNCLPNERRVRLFMDDPEREYIPVTIILRHYRGDISPPGQDPIEFIHMTMRGDHAMLPTDTSPTWIRVPYQEYTLEKQ